jgi:hypothetical protein
MASRNFKTDSKLQENKDIYEFSEKSAFE